jgi:hypothetical protein
MQMADGTRNRTNFKPCHRAKQKFGKPERAGDNFACQTLAFSASHDKDFQWNFAKFRKFIPP